MPISEPTTSDDADIDSDGSETNAAKTTWRVSVSLEFDINPVLTWRGEFAGGSPAGVASKALRAARKAFPKKQARSWVVVLQKLSL